MLFGVNVAYAEFKYTGSVGGRNGRIFDDSLQLPKNVPVRGVSIRAGRFIDAISIVLQDQKQRWHGGSGGNLYNFMLGKKEHITSISGYSGKYIDSIQVCTDLGRCSDSFGGNGGTNRYIFRAPKGYEIVGFTGREGGYIDALGAIYRPISASGYSRVDEFLSQIPVGGRGGQPFNDKGGISSSDQLTRILIFSGRYVDGFASTYVGGRTLRHGGKGGSLGVFELNLNTGEYLKQIVVNYGKYIDSIRFVTSQGKSSPLFGGSGGHQSKIFTAPSGHEIIGFHGSAGRFIDSLGIITRPWKRVF